MEIIVINVVFIDMVTRIDFERYINLPIAEQRNRCNSILTENNGDLPNFEDAAVDIGMPIEDYMKQLGAVKLGDFQQKIDDVLNDTK